MPPPTGNKIEIMPHQTNFFLPILIIFTEASNDSGLLKLGIALLEEKTNNQDIFAVVPKLICVIPNKYFLLIKFTIARKLIFMCLLLSFTVKEKALILYW